MLEEQTKGRVRISDVQIGISIYQQPFPWVKQAVESALQQNCDDRIICCIRIDGPSGCDIQTKEWLNDLSKTNACVKVIFGTTQLGTFGSYREIFEKEESEYLCQLMLTTGLNQTPSISAYQYLGTTHNQALSTQTTTK